MKNQFPAVDPARLEWVNIANENGLLFREKVCAAVICPFEKQHIEEVMVEVHRKQGGLIPTTELAQYLVDHLRQGTIRISDRSFTGFGLVAMNGVATSWQNDQLCRPGTIAPAT